MRLAKGHLQAFAEVVQALSHHRDLTFEMARRELSDRYAGQAFGMLWALIHPVFMMGLYVFVFAVVFKQKIGGTADLPLDYPAYLLSGLVSWLSFQEALNKSCIAITSNAALVKQVVFPLEILPVKTVLASLFPMTVSLLALTLYVFISNGFLHWTYLLLPLLVFMQVMMMIGLAYLLAPIGAYFRDIKDIVQLFALLGVYLIPVFYLPAWVPELFKPILYINPFTYFIWCYQDLLYFGRFEHPWAWLAASVLSVTTFVLGYRTFRKLKPTLGNTL
jgi:lipopolysaccharide transport system permease protein